MSTSNGHSPCPKCGTPIGELHQGICTVAQCPECGGQMLSCGCSADDVTHPWLPWTGKWPGEAECEEFGWYAVINPNGPGWVACAPGTPGSQPNLNRLHAEAKWDPDRARFVLESRPAPEA